MIYGATIPIIENDDTDELGVRKLTLMQEWPTQEAGRPAEPGGLVREAGLDPAACLVGTTSAHRGALRQFRWLYEGIGPQELRSRLYKGRGRSDVFRLDTSFEERAIWLHPRRKQLLDRYDGAYNGDTGKVDWSETDPETGEANPLYGIQRYLEIGAVWVYSYIEPDLSKAALDDVGTVVAPPGNPPKFKRRNWLKGPPKAARRGNVVQVDEEYWLSAPGGWIRPIYSVGQA